MAVRSFRTNLTLVMVGMLLGVVAIVISWRIFEAADADSAMTREQEIARDLGKSPSSFFQMSAIADLSARLGREKDTTIRAQLLSRLSVLREVQQNAFTEAAASQDLPAPVRQALEDLQKGAQGIAQIIDDQLLPTFQKDSPADALSAVLDKLDQAMDAVEPLADKLSDASSQWTTDLNADITLAIQKARIACLVAAVLIGLLVPVAMIVLLRRSGNELGRIHGALTYGATQLSNAADQVAKASQSLADGTNRSAAALQETSTSLEQMTVLLQSAAENSGSASAMAKMSLHGSEQGTIAIKELVDAIQRIKANADKCARIVKTIDEIAFQTNLLALNAAVEAARAGDAGRGFSVVAEEVRNLAQRAGAAAQETSALIESSIGSAEMGVQLTSKVTSIVGDFSGSSRDMNTLVGGIATSAGEILQGISQISQALRDMDGITSGNAANAEQGAAVGEELSAQAQAMVHEISTLEPFVSGSSAKQAQQTRPQATAPEPHREARRETLRGVIDPPRRSDRQTTNRLTKTHGRLANRAADAASTNTPDVRKDDTGVKSADDDRILRNF